MAQTVLLSHRRSHSWLLGKLSQGMATSPASSVAVRQLSKQISRVTMRHQEQTRPQQLQHLPARCLKVRVMLQGEAGTFMVISQLQC